jgi:1-phosphofructokinase
LPTILTVTLNPAVDWTLEVPNFRPGKTYRGTLKAFRAAGKGVNVSAVLATLGRPSVALGFVGQHEQSFFRAALHPALVDCRLAAVNGVTRHHTTIIDPARRTETHLREQGFMVNDTLVRELKRSIGAVLRGGDWTVFSGSLPPGMDTRRFVDLVRYCTQVGARVVVDAEREVLAAPIGMRLELIKPNVEELAELTGRAIRGVVDLVEAARSVCQKRVKAVLASWGDRGAYLITLSEVWHGRVKLAAEEVVNSVGCGDALLAGFLAAAGDGKPPAECLRLAVACAAADALTYAAGDVEPNSVARFLKAAVVEPVDAERDRPKASRTRTASPRKRQRRSKS